MSKGIAYFGRKLKHMDIKSFIAVPTTSGTGSEVTAFAVLTDSETQIKYPLVDDAVLPDEALLTPLFVKTSPPNVTAFSGIDVLVHALEAYVATAANNFTDALAQQAIELVFEYLPKCHKPSATEPVSYTHLVYRYYTRWTWSFEPCRYLCSRCSRYLPMGTSDSNVYRSNCRRFCRCYYCSCILLSALQGNRS